MTETGTIRRAHWLMVAIVLASGVLSLLFAERIQLSEGLGMDGTNYGAIASDFRGWVFERGVNQYYLKRAAPSAVVHYGLRAFGQPTDFPRVILGYQVYNLLLLLAAALLWRPIADRLGLGIGARWLGFVALFVNYANVKHAWYMPVFTDVTAFVLGTIYLWAWLAGRQVVLLGASLVGAFCWPIAALAGAILLFFPRRATPLAEEPDTKLPTLGAVGIAALLGLGFAYMYWVRDIRKVGMGPTIPPIESLVPIALAIQLAWILLAYRGLLAGIGTNWIVGAVRAIRMRDVALAAAAVIVPALVVRALAAPDPAILDSRGFLRSVVYLPNARPFVAFVSHVVWFGPALWLLVFHWRAVGRLAREMGPGLVAFLGFSLFVALTPESRQSNLGFPFFVALGCVAAEQAGLRARVTLALTLFGLALSKFWLRINTEEALAYARSGQIGLSDADSALQYRLYYLSQGPWMPNRWYALQLVIVLAIGAVVFLLHRRRAGAVERAAPAIQPAMPAT